ncbi:hypothetical protein STAS_20895 [Striga asiatica]|uniref:DUF7950 domain-containing protein n=1 Tax=Striga asiatica TaxID=4170 RepID=A0A5A7QFE6_STRAF|nr:hypothetical protein STAS_20895 [Striga asiatica]
MNCVARYAGAAYDVSKMDRIMLKFRPIAPKPTSPDGSGSVSGCASGGYAEPRSGRARAKSGRGKRRREVGNRRNNFSRRRNPSPEKGDSGGSVTGGDKDVRTLRLLPEEPGVKENRKVAAPNRSYPLWLSFGDEAGAGWIEADRTEVEWSAWRRAAVVQSWVKVEQVAEAWAAVGMGCTDEEKVLGLHRDTCPGFISDETNRVSWTNEAFRRMVGGEEGEEVAAWVVVERGVTLPTGCVGFTCRARVVTCRDEKGVKTVPCDAWRLDCGGFAWRLDTTAALSLWVGH